MTNRRSWLAGLAVMAALVAFYRRHLRPWMYSWGATAEEFASGLPGDELLEPGVIRTTRAIAIDAPVEYVWPWLAQIGEDRGGFYSYSVLERAAGTDIHNAHHIHPEWQELRVGDDIWLARRYGDRGRQVVAAVEPMSFLVLVSTSDYERIRHGGRARGGWAFHLHPAGSGTRLLIRGSGGPVGHAAFDVPHFVMERKMMRGIRWRAQHLF